MPSILAIHDLYYSSIINAVLYERPITRTKLCAVCVPVVRHVVRECYRRLRLH